jgi:hypothetical protein
MVLLSCRFYSQQDLIRSPRGVARLLHMQEHKIYWPGPCSLAACRGIVITTNPTSPTKYVQILQRFQIILVSSIELESFSCKWFDFWKLFSSLSSIYTSAPTFTTRYEQPRKGCKSRNARQLRHARAKSWSSSGNTDATTASSARVMAWFAGLGL